MTNRATLVLRSSHERTATAAASQATLSNAPLGIREFDQLLPDLFGIGVHAECRMQRAAVDDGR